MIPEKLNSIARNYDLSPYTGWTRDHWLACLEAMLGGVLKCFDGDKLWPQIPPSRDGDGLVRQLVAPGGASEMLNRTMMLAATYIAATGKTTIDGFDGDIAELYRRCIGDSLSEPFAAKRKGRLYKRFGPAAHISLLLAWDHLYEPLDGAVKAKMADYLRCYVEHFSNESNLLLFSMTPAVVLERMGESYSRNVSDGMFANIMNMYRGGGWFIDGWNQQYDSYNFWGFQLYLHLLVSYDEKWASQYGPAIKEITRLHEKTLGYWFDSSGAPMPKSRSMNYRFATTSGIQWAQKSQLGHMAPGLARRICSGCLKYFIEDHSTLRDDMILPIGYWGENSSIGENYTDTGAPYWSATGLVALTLEPDHPFWTQSELPAVSDSDQSHTLALPGAGMTLKTGGPRRESRAIVAEERFRHCHIWQAGIKFYQHAYSTALGYPLTGEGGEQLSVGRTGVSDDGDKWLYRTKPLKRLVTADRCVSQWNLWQADSQLTGQSGLVVTETIILPRGELHVFTHFADRDLLLRLGGWAVRLNDGEQVRADSSENSLQLLSEFNASVMIQLPLSANVAGQIEIARPAPRDGFKHTHLFGGVSCWPQWTSCKPVAAGQKVAIFVDAARNSADAQPEADFGHVDIAQLTALAEAVELSEF